jgi:hypothetical protein
MLTLILDSVPILIFIMWFIWLYARNVIGMRPPFAAASAAAFLVATLLAFPFRRRPPRGPRLYPRPDSHAGAGGVPREGTGVARFTLLAAAGVYLAALFFRTIDNEVCPVLPIGTHFVWHLLIGLVTYLRCAALILGARTTTARPRVR